jgi:hypothetical protein
MSAIDERLRGLGIALLYVIPPVVDGYVPVFAPFVRSGDHPAKTPRTRRRLAVSPAI